MSDDKTISGLSSAEVTERVAAGMANVAPQGTSRSIGQIFIANIFNPVNAIMLALFGLILLAGFPRDGLFVGVVASNSIIGIAQELYARRALKRLELLNAPVATVRRDGGESEIQVHELVVDDIVLVSAGDQIVVDGTVVSAAGLQIDESLLTGEADAVDKHVDDEVLSGSFVSAGSGVYLATKVGADSYANALAEEAKRFDLVNSELRRGINLILRVLVFLIPPSALLLLLSLLDVEDRWQNALQGTVAAAVAMVPDGLVLLTSLAFVAGVLALARRQALAKELATVELLARVDTLCLDKTGTITTGEISFGSVIALSGFGDTEVGEALGALAASDPTPNPTMAAVATAHGPPEDWEVQATEPFSSVRKWSAAQFDGRGTYYVGAPDILFSDADVDEQAQARAEAEQGRRVLLLSHSDNPLDSRDLPADRRPAALILLEDTVRPDAPEIFKFFAEQGVQLKVISGDSVATVAAVAARAGVPQSENSMDARELPEDQNELAEVLEHMTVFGRVTPHQKRAMVGAMQSRGRIVAMTGDGVNDVLALKDSNMGIAMGSGSSASRGVADVVLLDNRFATLPEVLAQGRKVINNIERVANLFVTKTVYAVVLTALIGFQGVEFPFLPRHLTLIGTFSIGLPGLFLALAPNVNLVRTGFLRRVLRFSVAAGLVAGAATWAVYTFARREAGETISPAELADARSASTLTLLGIGLVILVVVSRPLRLWKVGLAGGMAALYAIVLTWNWPRDYFELTIPDGTIWTACVVAVAVGGALIAALPLVIPGIRMAKAVTREQ